MSHIEHIDSSAAAVNFTFPVSHVALLTRSVTASAVVISSLGHEIGPVETWESEGTREIYVGAPDLGARLLLMEPSRDGSYARALAKRGPGLHHIGIDVSDMRAYAARMEGSGWFLLPSSLNLWETTKTIWLGRPGIPMLIEAHERPAPAVAKKALVECIEYPKQSPLAELVAAAGLESFIRFSAGSVARINLAGHWLSIEEIVNPT